MPEQLTPRNRHYALKAGLIGGTLTLALLTGGTTLTAIDASACKEGDTNACDRSDNEAFMTIGASESAFILGGLVTWALLEDERKQRPNMPPAESPS